MKTKNILAATALIIGLTACIPSVKPFFTAKDLVFETKLLGEWQEKGKTNDPACWKFEREGTNDYKLTIKESEEKEGVFSAHLFKVKTEYFLDLTPTKCEFAKDQTDWVAFAMFPGHLLARITQFEPELKLAFFDFDKLTKLLKENPSAVEHHQENDRFVLTADTAALQRFVMSHLGEGELFGEAGEMVRKSP